METKNLDLANQVQTFRLDNAATLFSLVTSKRITAMFRLTASLTDPIKVSLLQKALDNIIVRFPYYRVNQKTGLFWYYWKTNFGKPKVIADSKYPCEKMPIRKKGIFPFRVRAFRNRIAVEFHHSITDGTGALTFLKALVFEYSKLNGKKLEEAADIYKTEDIPDSEEYEDAYKKNYKESYPSLSMQSRAFHLPYKLEKPGIYHIISGITPVDKVLEVSKEKNVTLTELLSAAYIDSLQKILFSLPEKQRKRLMKPIRLQIPVKLRRIFPSKTMRNFSLYVTPGIDPRLGIHTFDEILKEIYHYMRLEINDKYINKQIKRNVRGELHPLMRATPLPIKRMGGKIIYKRMGENLYSGILTNLGRLAFTETLKEDILDFQFIPAPNAFTKISCGVLSYKNNLFINFGRVVKETEVEKHFFRKLRELGIPIKIETN